MKIIAIDPATKTGWAHNCGASGVWDLSIRKDESSGMRLIRFESKLREVLCGPGIDLIVFESVSAGQGPRANFDSVKLQAKLQAVIERFVEKTSDLQCRGYNIQEIKKHALPGKGKRNKRAMLDAARKRWPDVEIVDDNEADALWLLDLATTEYGDVETS